VRVLVCGDRKWAEPTLIQVILRGFLADNFFLIEGCAPGADRCAHDWGLEFLDEEHHLHFPAQWQVYGRGAGPRRNQAMLEQGEPDLALAFHNNLEASKGTKDMVSRALGAGIKVVHIKSIGGSR